MYTITQVLPTPVNSQVHSDTLRQTAHPHNTCLVLPKVLCTPELSGEKEGEKIIGHQHISHMSAQNPNPQWVSTQARRWPGFLASLLISQERGLWPTCQPAVCHCHSALTFRAGAKMIAFSCNVPQTALTFGKYSTSGPIRLPASS